MFRQNFRASQGQVANGSPGGGYSMDQINMRFGSHASNAYPVARFLGAIAQVDTQPVGATILSDVEPMTVSLPLFRIQRLSLALNGSVSATGVSNPIFTVKRFRAGVSAVVATWDYQSSVSAPVNQFVHRTGAQVSNGSLQAGDILKFNTASTGGSLPVPEALVQVDIVG